MVGEKFVLYQLLLRAFGNRDCISGGSYAVNGSGKFNEITATYLRKLHKLSVGAVWYTGIISHATRTSFNGVPSSNPSLVKGEAGSPYAIRNYFDVDPALAVNPDNRMTEFMNLVSRTHSAGMKVIIDFVPNHVAREYGGYFTSENYYLLDAPLQLPCDDGGYVENPAKATGNNVFNPAPSANDWYDTVKLNYDNRSTWVKMLDILRFWLEKGVDGFRCDMVELVPSEFFKWAFAEVRKTYPQTLFIAEVYGKENYGRYADAGFDYLYDKSGFYDALRDIVGGRRPASCLTGEWQSIDNLQPRMLNFLENHDEQRAASDFYAGNAKKTLPALAVSLLFNTAPFMLYFGQEFGERGMESEGFSGVDGRTSIYDYCTVPSVRRFLEGRLSKEEDSTYKLYCRLLKTATADAIFSRGKTFDLMYVNPSSPDFDAESQFAWMRGYDGKAMLLVANFSDRPVNVTVRVPKDAFAFFALDGDADAMFSLRVKANDFVRVDVQ